VIKEAWGDAYQFLTAIMAAVMVFGVLGAFGLVAYIVIDRIRTHIVEISE
jgi:hypothetical protein